MNRIIQKQILVTWCVVIIDFVVSSMIMDFSHLLVLQGGIAFIAIKGVLRIYFKQQQYIRQAQRKILNFEEHQQVQNQGPAQPTSTQ